LTAGTGSIKIASCLPQTNSKTSRDYEKLT
jgi:hypothetical protein